jgi:hypothetical protein
MGRAGEAWAAQLGGGRRARGRRRSCTSIGEGWEKPATFQNILAARHSGITALSAAAAARRPVRQWGAGRARWLLRRAGAGRLAARKAGGITPGRTAVAAAARVPGAPPRRHGWRAPRRCCLSPGPAPPALGFWEAPGLGGASGSTPRRAAREGGGAAAGIATEPPHASRAAPGPRPPGQAPSPFRRSRGRKAPPTPGRRRSTQLNTMSELEADPRLRWLGARVCSAFGVGAESLRALGPGAARLLRGFLDGGARGPRRSRAAPGQAGGRARGANPVPSPQSRTAPRSCSASRARRSSGRAAMEPPRGGWLPAARWRRVGAELGVPQPPDHAPAARRSSDAGRPRGEREEEQGDEPAGERGLRVGAPAPGRAPQRAAEPLASRAAPPWPLQQSNTETARRTAAQRAAPPAHSSSSSSSSRRRASRPTGAAPHRSSSRSSSRSRSSRATRRESQRPPQGRPRPRASTAGAAGRRRPSRRRSQSRRCRSSQGPRPRSPRSRGAPPRRAPGHPGRRGPGDGAALRAERRRLPRRRPQAAVRGARGAAQAGAGAAGAAGGDGRAERGRLPGLPGAGAAGGPPRSRAAGLGPAQPARLLRQGDAARAPTHTPLLPTCPPRRSCWQRSSSPPSWPRSAWTRAPPGPTRWPAPPPRPAPPPPPPPARAAGASCCWACTSSWARWARRCSSSTATSPSRCPPWRSPTPARRRPTQRCGAAGPGLGSCRGGGGGGAAAVLSRALGRAAAAAQASKSRARGACGATGPLAPANARLRARACPHPAGGQRAGAAHRGVVVHAGGGAAVGEQEAAGRARPAG